MSERRIIGLPSGDSLRRQISPPGGGVAWEPAGKVGPSSATPLLCFQAIYASVESNFIKAAHDNNAKTHEHADAPYALHLISRFFWEKSVLGVVFLPLIQIEKI